MSGGLPGRMAVDIGGTFTDVAVEVEGRTVTAKVLTTPEAPELGVLAGIEAARARGGGGLQSVGLLLHGTTLATNALIERKGAVTALVTTEGFRDAVEIGQENRFEQYDVYIEKPAPLVPRRRRLTVPERIGSRGEVLRPLDESAAESIAERLGELGVESVAIGFLHSYANPAHEVRVRELLAARLPALSFSLSSEVSPELREYERLSTTCANAYVQPRLAGYLGRLAEALRERGFRGSLLLMTSGGGVIGLEAARRFPIRLVESGPAGGALLASRVGVECGIARILAFDMGGTTAKICIIDDGEPESSRSFEVARAYRFLKGSGLPLRIPVIEMVEIGAGGGSIARVDALGRIAIGPDSAGASPGPACYGRGGSAATVTDADLLLGKLDPLAFAGGSIPLDAVSAERAVARAVGEPQGLDASLAALAMAEVVDENMASAARVHAVERGKDLEGRTLIAFGGAAPLHAARLAAKLGISRIVVPTGAGVGSAIGMLRAPVAYEVARTLYQRLDDFDLDAVNTHLAAMTVEASEVVSSSAPGERLTETRVAYMRYVGQGHEITVDIPPRPLAGDDVATLQAAFERAYEQQFSRAIPGLSAEVLSWAVAIRTTVETPRAPAEPPSRVYPGELAMRDVLDASGETVRTRLVARAALRPGDRLAGPLLVLEDETTTWVPPGFTLGVNGAGYLGLEEA